MRRRCGDSAHGLWLCFPIREHGRMKRRLLSLSSICALIFLSLAIPEHGVVTDDAHPNVYYGIDRAIARLGLGFGESGRRPLFLFAKVSPILMLIAVSVCAVFARKRRRTDLLLLSTLCFAMIIPLVETLLKNWVNRTSYGHTMFPSGHTSMATAAAMIVGITTSQLHSARRARRIAPLLIGYVFAEIALLLRVRAHWFTDTVGGICVGVGWMSLCFAILNPLTAKLSERRFQESKRGKHSLRGPESVPYRKGLAWQDVVDRRRHGDVELSNSVPCVVGSERDVHPVVGVGPRWMVIQPLGDQCDAAHEVPGFVEVTEEKRAM